MKQTEKQENQTQVTLLSFGHKHGVPEAEILMDVRFLNNPYWVPALQNKTGLDKDVGEFIAAQEAFGGFLEKFKTLLATILPYYRQEGRMGLTIAIGCTGGQHRSVYTVETLGAWLKERGTPVTITHRDVVR